MATPSKNLYDTDFAKWRTATAKLIRSGRFDAIDVAHLAEEVEDLGKSEKRELESRLAGIIEHLLKLKLTTGQMLEQNRRGWLASVLRQQSELEGLFKDSPSLRAGLTAALLQRCYRRAVVDVTREYDIKPAHRCPFQWAEVLPPAKKAAPKKRKK